MNHAKQDSGKRQAVVRLLPKPDVMEIWKATNAQESERVIIGAILHDGPVYFSVAADLQPGDFGGLHYAMIYRAMQQIAQRGDEIDAVMVADEIQKPDYKAVHGSVTLESLLGLLREPPRTSLLETHVKRIRDTALRVRLLQAADEIRASALDKSLSVDAIVTATDDLIDTATERTYQSASDMVSIATGFYNQVDAAAKSGRPLVLKTGFMPLDEYIGGLAEGELSILAGGPGKGKSTVMLSIVLSKLIEKKRVALFSLEMSQFEVCQKLVTMLTGIPALAFRKADLTPNQMAQFAGAIGSVADFPLDVIDDWPQMTPGQFVRRARQLMRRQDIDLFVIDGLWLMAPDEPHKDRHIEVSRITKALLAFIKTVRKPLLVMHQLTQDLNKRADKTPTIYDLAESAAVQRDAQLILGLHRVSYAGQKYEASQCWILKDRAGGRAGGMATLFFDGAFQTYYAADGRVSLEESNA